METGAVLPLKGIKVVEFESVGPVPFVGMLLADMGAEVVRLCRPPSDEEKTTQHSAFLDRRKRIRVVDLKSSAGHAIARQEIDAADILIEGFRPGILERLGLGPDDCLRSNPSLVYGRMSGWGQDGPLANAAGHDINYLAIAGLLGLIGPAEGDPIVPLSIIADFGGGALYLALGVVAGLVGQARSGSGAVVDAAMIDGVNSLATMIHAVAGAGKWNAGRESNLVDGGAHFYNIYRTKDDRHVAVGAVEPKFYQRLLQVLDIEDDPLFKRQTDEETWSEARQALTELFARKTRAEWEAIFDGVDACVTPVLTLDEARNHPHLVARRSFSLVDGTCMPTAAPRISKLEPPRRQEHDAPSRP